MLAGYLRLPYAGLKELWRDADEAQLLSDNSRTNCILAVDHMCMQHPSAPSITKWASEQGCTQLR